MSAVDGFAQGGEAGKEVFVRAGAEFRDGAAVGADDGEGLLFGPDEAVEHAKALKELAGGEFEDPAIAAVHILVALEADDVAGQEFGGDQQGLDVANVGEVLGGEDQALKGVGRGADQLFGAFARWGEDDVAGLAVLATARTAFFDHNLLAVSILSARVLRGEFAFGDAAGEIRRRIGGGQRGW